MAFRWCGCSWPASKPEWQILTNRRSGYHPNGSRSGGRHTKQIVLWKVNNPEGKEERVLTIGTRVTRRSSILMRWPMRGRRAAGSGQRRERARRRRR